MQLESFLKDSEYAGSLVCKIDVVEQHIFDGYRDHL